METMGQAGYPATGGALWTGSEEDVVFLCTWCATKFGSARQPSRCPCCGATGKPRDFPTYETSRIALQNDHFRVTLGMDAGIRFEVNSLHLTFAYIMQSRGVSEMFGCRK